MKRDLLGKQFGILEHDNGYSVTALNGTMTYAIVANDGIFHLYPEVEDLPEWHQKFLKSNLMTKNNFRKCFTL